MEEDGDFGDRRMRIGGGDVVWAWETGVWERTVVWTGIVFLFSCGSTLMMKVVSMHCGILNKIDIDVLCFYGPTLECSHRPESCTYSTCAAHLP